MTSASANPSLASTQASASFPEEWTVMLSKQELEFSANLAAIYGELLAALGGVWTDEKSMAKKIQAAGPEVAKFGDEIHAILENAGRTVAELRQNAKTFDEEQNTAHAHKLFPFLLSSPLTNHESATRILAYLKTHKVSSEGGALFQLVSPLQLQQELMGLRDMAAKIDKDVLAGLVAHRGFHYVNDSVARPLENTLQAMEQAWANGVLFCECDVIRTTDGHVMLCHDDDLSRLALFPTHTSSRPIADLTFSEVIACPLKNGVRKPLLRDVLETAHRISPSYERRLVIELKPHIHSQSDFVGTLGTAVADLLLSDSAMLLSTEMVMSFDKREVQSFSAQFDKIQSARRDQGESVPARPPVLLLTVRNGHPEYELAHTPIDAKLVKLGESLINEFHIPHDGLYMEFDDAMLGSGKSHFAELCHRMKVGVWGVKPDNHTVAKQLRDLGATYVNTDIPQTFLDSL